MYVWHVQGYPLYHLVKAQTEKQAGAKEDALVSLQTAMSFITSKKPGMNTQAWLYSWGEYHVPGIGCQLYLSAVHVIASVTISTFELLIASILCLVCVHVS